MSWESVEGDGREQPVCHVWPGLGGQGWGSGTDRPLALASVKRRARIGQDYNQPAPVVDTHTHTHTAQDERRPAGKGSWPQGSPEILPRSGFSSSDLWLEWPCSQCLAENQPRDVLSLKQSPLAPTRHLSIPQKWIGLGQQDQNVPLSPAVPFLPRSLSLSVRGSSLKCVTRGLGLNPQASWVIVQGPLAPTEGGLGALTPGTSPIMREEASPTCLTGPHGPCSSAAEELLGWSRLSRQHHSWPFTTQTHQAQEKRAGGVTHQTPLFS